MTWNITFSPAAQIDPKSSIVVGGSHGMPSTSCGQYPLPGRSDIHCGCCNVANGAATAVVGRRTSIGT